MTNFGSPFRNSDAGIKVCDPENDRRIRLAFERFWKSKADDKEFQAQVQTSVSKEAVNAGFVLGPVGGLLLGKAYIDMFCNPKYSYFRGFLLIGFTLAGLSTALACKNRYEYSLYTRNFKLFPTELQQALENGDARYATQWWKN